jgi:glycosyltransferase involved in cell wall biosynthesis
MICPELPRPGNPGTMAPAMRQFQSIRDLGIETEIVDMQGIPKLKYLQVLPRIRRLAKQVDVIHAHFGYCGWLARLASLFMGSKKPIIMSFMGDDLLGTPYNTNGDLERFSRFAVRCNQLMSHGYTKIIVKSREMAEVLAPIPSEIIPNGVDIQKFQPMDRKHACDSLKIPSDGFYVLFPGNPENPRKGYDTATKAIALAEKSIGKPIRVLALRGVAEDDVPLYMNACHAMLMTSFIEGSPNVVKEAMATDLPVIGVPVGDVHELLDGVTNCSRCSRDPVQIGDALAKTLLTNERSNGRSAILSRGLDLLSVSHRVANVYEQSLQIYRKAKK